MFGRIAVFNCHEAWVYQLRALAQPIDIITDLPGREVRGWDLRVRPLPPQSRLLSLAEAKLAPLPYHAIIAHNLSDLLDARELCGPRILVLHMTLDGIILEQSSTTPPLKLKQCVAEYVRRTGTHVVSVSHRKGASWGFVEDLVLLSADPADYPAWQGNLPRGLRISNLISRRARTLLWSFHEQAFANVPVTLVGHNPDIPGVRASRDWPELKSFLQHHRFYIHTAQTDLEDGYNMATLEAMAAGLPVLGNIHPSSPVEHQISGFLSNDPQELQAFAELLIADCQLAAKIGQAAQARVRRQFSTDAFRMGMQQSIAKAHEKWRRAGSQLRA
jgi:hypothetical protein